MLTEIVTRPVKAAVALVELPLTAKRSLDEVNQLMEVSRRQLEAMQRQTDSALNQAERMNELLARVVKLTEPIEKAQRGGEYFAEGLRRMIFGEDQARPDAVAGEATGVEGGLARMSRATESELEAAEAELAALEADRAAGEERAALAEEAAAEAEARAAKGEEPGPRPDER